MAAASVARMWPWTRAGGSSPRGTRPTGRIRSLRCCGRTRSAVGGYWGGRGDVHCGHGQSRGRADRGQGRARGLRGKRSASRWSTSRRLGFAGRDVAIDLGTANTLVFVRGHGIVLSEPSVIALDTITGEVHAVGRAAQQMIGRTPATISAVRPLRHGVIADFEVTEQMLRYFLRQADGGRRRHPRVIVCAPLAVTRVEQQAVQEACLSAGAREVAL